MERVVEVTELQWGFDSEGPFTKVSPSPATHNHIRLDPTPAYPHSRDLVIETLKRCEEMFPLPVPVWVYNVHFEGLSRTNGDTRDWSEYSTLNEHGEYIGGSMILLYGKRTPIHPATTRALVAHEYGHAVDRALAAKRYKGMDYVEKQRAEYAKLRNLPKAGHYGPSTWHEMPSELIANDFRYLVMGIEREFWPHSAPTPDQVPEIQEWWASMRILDLTPGKYVAKSES